MSRRRAGNALRIFLIFSFAGWMVDSAYRSVLAGAVVLRGPTIPPFYPTYGLAALIMTWIIPRVAERPLAARITIYTAATSGWELAAGIFLTYGIGWPLWDYSGSAIHFLGLIDLEHSFYWTVLALLSERYVYPLVRQYILKLPDAGARTTPALPTGESGNETPEVA